MKSDDEDLKQKFLSTCTYVSGAYDEDSAFQNLLKKIEELESKDKNKERLFYLALPPNQFTTVAQKIKKNLYPDDKNDKIRLIIEKPFGKDLKSSRELQKNLAPLFTEDEIFRIDHYLGKEMVKNLLVFRFGNEFINASWNRQHIASVQISFKEPFGTEGRGGYFDEIGMIRDVIQNHLLQVLTLLAMDRPVSFGSEDIRNEKVKLLKAIQPIDFNDTVIGQYDKSEDGTKPAYIDDETVNPDSNAATYAAIGLKIHNERWEGVPFILRAGKALNEAKVEVRIQFKEVARGIFNDINRNELLIRIQPQEAIYMKINNKTPGLSHKTTVTELGLSYTSRYSDLHIPEAYESLILDALNNDHSNFVRDDELDLSWKLFTPLLNHLDDGNIKPEKYPYGSRGPPSLKDFIERHNYIHNPDSCYTWPQAKSGL